MTSKKFTINSEEFEASLSENVILQKSGGFCFGQLLAQSFAIYLFFQNFNCYGSSSLCFSIHGLIIIGNHCFSSSRLSHTTVRFRLVPRVVTPADEERGSNKCIPMFSLYSHMRREGHGGSMCWTCWRIKRRGALVQHMHASGALKGACG